jgi:hypothetical protein
MIFSALVRYPDLPFLQIATKLPLFDLVDFITYCEYVSYKNILTVFKPRVSRQEAG